MSVIKRNNVRISGQGTQPMLFVNGYGCDQSIWRYVIPEFEDNYKIILFDHVGSGDSDHTEYDKVKYNSLQGYASDLVEICKELDLTNVIIVAHSVGCMISMLAAIQSPENFKKLVMVSPSPCYINDSEYYGGFTKSDIEQMIDTLESNYLGWVTYISPVITGNADHPEYAKEINNRFCRNNPEIAKHFANVTFLSDNRQDLPLLNKPTLIIQVSDDVIAPVKVGEYMNSMISDSKLAMIEGNGHCPHLSHPEQTVFAIESFINQKEKQFA